MLIKVATGIGAGIVSGGQLQRGAQGTAGDLGHVRVARAGDVQCRCGNLGCSRRSPQVRRWPLPCALAASTPATVRTSSTSSGPATATPSRSCASGRDIGDVVAMMVNLINPSVVVIGGQLAAAGEHLLAGIREVVYQRSLPLATEHLSIVPSRAGGEAGVLGAATMAIEHVLSPEAIEAASLAITAL